MTSGRKWWAPTLAVVAIGMGASFEAWMAAFHFPGKYPRIHTVLWAVPAAGWVLGLIASRKLSRAFVWTTAVSGLLLLILYPVVHHYGVLKNLSNLMSPLLVAAVLAALAKPGWGRRTAVVVLGLSAAWAFYRLGDFRIFNLEIVKFRGASWLKKNPDLATLSIALLAAGFHAFIEEGIHWKRGLWALAAGVGASGIIELPVYGYAVPTALIFVSFFWRRFGHARMLSMAFAWAAPFMYQTHQLYGLYATVAIVVVGLWLTKQIALGEAGRWASGVFLMLGAYMGLAWTFGLTTAGIDFTFAIQWLPGRLHEQFWWVIAIVMVFKCMAHITLMVIAVQRLFGTRAEDITNAAAGLSLLRYTFVAFFSIAWLIAADEQAGGMRLAAMLQDAFYWLVPGLVMAGIVRLGPRPTPSETEE